MAAKTEPDPAQADPAEPAAPALEDRVGALEGDVAETKGMVRTILDRLPGGEPAADPAPAGPGTPDPAADIQSTVRAEIAATKAREAEEARARGDAEWRTRVDQTLEELKPEQAPREPQTGVKGRLQRAMFGKPE